MAHPAAPLFDADNHYYETRDCFTRHMPKALQDRAIRVTPDAQGRNRIWVGERPFTFLENWSFTHANRPGALRELLLQKDYRDEASGLSAPIAPDFQQRDARLALMDAQGLEATFLFPTLAVCVEHFMKDDPEQLVANFRAFNRWLDEDWGFAWRGRIFAVPLLSLVDLAEHRHRPTALVVGIFLPMMIFGLLMLHWHSMPRFALAWMPFHAILRPSRYSCGRAT